LGCADTQIQVRVPITTRDGDHAVSQRIRKRVEEIFD
jgi:hypothetical protein